MNNSAADDLQTLLTVAENLRTNLRDEEERMRQSNKHYDDLYNRLEDTLKNWAVDKETIRGQRSEIGKEKNSICWKSVRPEALKYNMRGCPLHGIF